MQTKLLYSIVFLFLSTFTAFAQNNTNDTNLRIVEPKSNISVGVGLTTYQGDLVEPRIDFGVAHLAFAAGYGYYFNDKLTGNISLLFGQISGSDADYESRVARGFSLDATSLVNVSLGLDYYFVGKNHYRKDENTALYVSGGLGLAFVNPEAQGIAENSEDEFGGSAFGFQIGGGIKQHFSEKFSLGLELSYRPLFSDLIDGISKNGNSDNIDTFVWIGLAATYQLGDKM